MVLMVIGLPGYDLVLATWMLMGYCSGAGVAEAVGLRASKGLAVRLGDGVKGGEMV